MPVRHPLLPYEKGYVAPSPYDGEEFSGHQPLYIPLYGHHGPSRNPRRITAPLNEEEKLLYLERYIAIEQGRLPGYLHYGLDYPEVPLPDLIEDDTPPIEPLRFPRIPYLELSAATPSSNPIPEIRRDTISLEDADPYAFLTEYLHTQPWNTTTYNEASDYVLKGAYNRCVASMRNARPITGAEVIDYCRRNLVNIYGILQFFLDEELRCSGYSPVQFSDLPTHLLLWYEDKRIKQSVNYDQEWLIKYRSELAMRPKEENENEKLD